MMDAASTSSSTSGRRRVSRLFACVSEPSRALIENSLGLWLDYFVRTRWRLPGPRAACRGIRLLLFAVVWPGFWTAAAADKRINKLYTGPYLMALRIF